MSTDTTTLVTHVAVFDDDLPFIRMVEHALGESGMSVQPVTTFDLSEAVRVISESGSEVGLIDIFMYGEDAGFRLIERLREDPRTADMPLIVTSGAEREVERHAAFLDEHGCKLLLKPFRPDELVNAISSCHKPIASLDRA